MQKAVEYIYRKYFLTDKDCTCVRLKLKPSRTFTHSPKAAFERLCEQAFKFKPLKKDNDRDFSRK